MCIVAQKFNYGTSTKLKFDNKLEFRTKIFQSIHLMNKQ